MCFAVAVAHLGTSALACDTRHSLYTTGGDSRRLDAGGKLVRVGRVWLTLGGDALHASVVLEQLASTDARSIEDVRAAIASAATDAAGVIASRWPGAPSAPDGRSVYFAALGGDVAAIRFDGKRLHQGSDLVLAAYPNGYALRDQAQAVLQAVVGTTRTRFSLVRLLAREFARVADHCESVSADVEIAVGSSYLTGNAAVLADASDAELDAAVCGVPLTRPAAFTQILEEYVS